MSVTTTLKPRHLLLYFDFNMSSGLCDSSTKLHASFGCFCPPVHNNNDYSRMGASALECTHLSVCLCHNLHQGFIFPSSLICPSMVALICMSPYRHALTKWPHLLIFFAAHVQSPHSVNVS